MLQIKAKPPHRWYRILRLQRDRYLEEFKVKWWEQSKADCPHETDVNTGITMETVGGVFIAMAIGLGLCLIALVVEVSFKKYRQASTSATVCRLLLVGSVGCWG